MFAKSLEDVWSNPRLLASFTDHLEARKVGHYAQFILDVAAFKASYSKGQGQQGGGGFSAIFRDRVVCSDSVDSFDSGIVSPGCGPDQTVRPLTPPSTSSSTRLSEEVAKTVQATAIAIYQT